jgi:protoheme ferro-lyase
VRKEKILELTVRVNMNYVPPFEETVELELSEDTGTEVVVSDIRT